MQIWFTMGLADKLLDKVVQPRILVVGDVMLDRYWFGDVDRISPEAPVPVVLVRQTEDRLGGAGNVALNIMSLGGKCTLCAIVGVDESADIIADTALSYGVGIELVRSADATTSIKQRVISRNQQLLRADFENPPAESAIASLTARAKALINTHEFVILSDYGKGALGQVQSIIQAAKEANVPVLVDPKGADFSRYAGATMITPNLKEFELVAGQQDDDTAISACVNRIMNQYKIRHILVTLSERGMRLFSNDGSELHSPARSREVYDVSGAGDTVIAVMAMSLGASLNPADAMQIANSAAGVVVSKLGTATASMTELKAAVSRDTGVC